MSYEYKDMPMGIFTASDPYNRKEDKVRERQIPHHLTYIWNLNKRKQNPPNSYIQSTDFGGCQSQRVEVGEMHEVSQKVQTFNYKGNKS